MTMRPLNLDDGVLVTQLRHCPHEDRLYRNFVQPDRPLILQRNANLRKNPSALNDLSFGRQELSIPTVDYEALKKKYPVLVQGSNAERTAFYQRFIKSSESLPYRVR